MAGLFGGGQQQAAIPIISTPPPPPPPPPMPVADTEGQKNAAARENALRRSRVTTRASTILGGDNDTLG